MSQALMTKSEYARYRGVGKSAVSNWIKRDQLVMNGSQVDVAASDDRLGALVDSVAGRPATASMAASTPKRSTPPAQPVMQPPAAPSRSSDMERIANERAQLLSEQRAEKALKNAKLAGELVPLQAAESKLATAVTGLCERMRSDLRGMAERLAMESDMRIIRTLLEEALDKVQNDMAQHFEADGND